MTRHQEPTIQVLDSLLETVFHNYNIMQLTESQGKFGKRFLRLKNKGEDRLIPILAHYAHSLLYSLKFSISMITVLIITITAPHTATL